MCDLALGGGLGGKRQLVVTIKIFFKPPAYTCTAFQYYSAILVLCVQYSVWRVLDVFFLIYVIYIFL